MGLTFDAVVVFLDVSDIYDQARRYRWDETGDLVVPAKEKETVSVGLRRLLREYSAISRLGFVLYDYAEAIAGFIQQRFEIADESAPVTLELFEVRKMEDVASVQRVAFSALFRGPDKPLLPQRVYPLEHPILGRLEVFLVPISQDDNGVCYEMVFA